MIADWFGNDKLNKKGNRDLNNTNRIGFNCGGYALETFNWYLPYDEEEQGREMFGIFADMPEEEVLEITVNAMLKEFRGRLRVIQKVEELKDDEYAIAYRVGERDFHYCKRNSRGVWFHKRGQTPKIERMTTEQVFSRSWGKGRYTSEVVLLAKKKTW